MKVVYHPSYCQIYAEDPAAAPGRIEAIRDAIESAWDFVEPDPAREADLLLVHTRAHLQYVKKDRILYETATLAAGGAILAARIALSGEPAFGLIRPPGHHASPGDCWGFCYFNNVAVSLAALFAEGAVPDACILDFDLHFGDGTVNCFSGDSRILYLHPEAPTAQEFVETARRSLAAAGPKGILAVSAGFDRGRSDWGNLLGEEDYRALGALLKEYAQEHCGGRRYALLEGGYHHGVLGRHVRAFLQGFEN